MVAVRAVAKRPLTTPVSKTNERMMRCDRGDLNFIRVHLEAIANAVNRMDQGRVKGLIDDLAQKMDMAAKTIALGGIFTPQKILEAFATDHIRAALHQLFEQF